MIFPLHTIPTPDFPLHSMIFLLHAIPAQAAT